MAKLVLNDLTNLNNTPATVAKINQNNDKIEVAIENTLSRNGTSPNQMGAPIDMNGQRILNLPAPVGPSEPLRKADVDLAAGAVAAQVTTATNAATAASGSASAAASSASSASTSATAAAGSATAAAGSATAANTSATNAQTYANNAATSAAAASALAGAAASAITFSPTGSIAATNVQAAVAEVASESYQLSSTTSFGRSLVAAADAGAVRNVLGISAPLSFDAAGGLTSITSNTTLAKTDQGKYLRVTADTVTTITLPASMALADAGWYVVLRFDNMPSNTAFCSVNPNGQTFVFRNYSTTSAWKTPGASETLMFLWTGASYIIHVIQNAPVLTYSWYRSISGGTGTLAAGWQTLDNAGGVAAPTYNLSGCHVTSSNPYIDCMLRYTGKYEVTSSVSFPAQTSTNVLGIGLGSSTSNVSYAQEYRNFVAGEDYGLMRCRETIEVDAQTFVYPNIYGAGGSTYNLNSYNISVKWLGR